MSERTPAAEAAIETEPGSTRVRLSGAWTTDRLTVLEEQLRGFGWPAGHAVSLDASGIVALDTGGAWLLQRILQQLAADGKPARLEGLRTEFGGLLALVGERLQQLALVRPPQPLGFLEGIGRDSWAHVEQGLALLAFIGETAVAILRTVLRPARIRWAALFTNLEQAGVNALPIVGLLSFLLGIVIAYQGGVQLRSYGANIFIVELVSLTMLRELAPMMAAIIVAGRTGSAFTAQIGTMKVTEEVDALRTIGISPMDLLVLPKLFGLAMALPLLTVFADAMGVLGGMVMAAVMLDVSFSDFLDRIPQTVSLASFVIGVGKAPVFAGIIAMVGCFQGFQVRGGADSVGRQTTASVVQSIFLVIVADAAFSILFSWLGI
jgi:phospholipid/cholesterol/gamma-HCH transport system permease protein